MMTVFAHLGADDEWPGTRDLAAEHARSYGVRHEVVYREVTGPDGHQVRWTAELVKVLVCKEIEAAGCPCAGLIGPGPG